jgi:hypothetical protein
MNIQDSRCRTAILDIVSDLRSSSSFVGIDAKIAKMLGLEDVVPFSRDIDLISDLTRETFGSWGVMVYLGTVETSEGYLAVAGNTGDGIADIFECTGDTPAHAMLCGLFETLEQELLVRA